MPRIAYSIPAAAGFYLESEEGDRWPVVAWGFTYSRSFIPMVPGPQPDLERGEWLLRDPSGSTSLYTPKG